MLCVCVDNIEKSKVRAKSFPSGATLCIFIHTERPVHTHLVFVSLEETLNKSHQNHSNLPSLNCSV